MGVEVGVRAGGQDDAQVPKHCDQVQRQKQCKEKRLQYKIIWEAQQKELWCTCIVLCIHVTDASSGDEDKTTFNEEVLGMSVSHYTTIYEALMSAFHPVLIPANESNLFD